MKTTMESYKRYIAAAALVLRLLASCSPERPEGGEEERVYRLSLRNLEYSIRETRSSISDASSGVPLRVHIYEHNGAFFGTFPLSSGAPVRLNMSRKYDYYLDSGYSGATIDGSAPFPPANSQQMYNSVYYGEAFRSSTWNSYGSDRWYHAISGAYGGSVPVAGCYMNMTPVELDLSDGSEDGFLHLEAERLFAMLNLNLRFDSLLSEWMEDIEIISVSAHTIPRFCGVYNPLTTSSYIDGGSFSPAPEDFIFETGDAISCPDDLRTTTGAGPYILYVPENLYGDDPDLDEDMEDIDKSPSNSGGMEYQAYISGGYPYATYIEVEVAYSSMVGAEGTVIYRYFPGSAVNNFSICRNTVYNITLTLSWDGFGITDDWRVDTSSWSSGNADISWDRSSLVIWTGQTLSLGYSSSETDLGLDWYYLTKSQNSGTPESTGGGLSAEKGAAAGSRGTCILTAYDPLVGSDRTNRQALSWNDQAYNLRFRSRVPSITGDSFGDCSVTLKHGYIWFENQVYNDMGDEVSSQRDARNVTVPWNGEYWYRWNIEDWRGPSAPKIHYTMSGDWSGLEDVIELCDDDGYYIMIWDEANETGEDRIAKVTAYIGDSYENALVSDTFVYTHLGGSGDDYAEFYYRTTYSLVQGKSVTVDIDYYDSSDDFIGVAWSSSSSFYDGSWQFYIDNRRIYEGLTYKGLSFSYEGEDNEDEYWVITASASAVPGTYTLKTKTVEGTTRYATLRVKSSGSGSGGGESGGNNDNDY
ncbi:MAG: hypothetical protein IJR77_00915 [Bacteroidales bacterium]|nr:hypothetical protein [Bacteroidales bacterium]